MNFQVFKLDIEKAEESESDGRSVMSNSLQLHGPSSGTFLNLQDNKEAGRNWRWYRTGDREAGWQCLLNGDWVEKDGGVPGQELNTLFPQ